MSKDLLLGRRCPHLVIEESVTLGADFRSLPTKAPVAGSQLARVYANVTSQVSNTSPETGADFATRYIIPPSGLHSQARIKGSTAGPFRIRGCASENGLTVDTNVVTISGSGETATFRLPTGSRVGAETLAKLFRNTLATIAVGVENGRLVLVDTAEIGKRSWIKITGRGAEAIGFVQKGARGRQVFPGWTLDKGEDLLTNVNFQGTFAQPARYFRFREPVKSNPILKVTYPAPGARCPRCGGTFVENDWQFDLSGDLIFIENEDLLYQAALKILLTERGSNPYHQAYGSNIINRIGSKAVGAVAQQLREDTISALNRMRTLQRGQARYQQVSLREQVYAINSVDVYPHNNDPTAYRVDVVLTNASGRPVVLNVVFTVPGAEALAGTNGLSLGVSGLTIEQQQNLIRTT